MKLKHLIHEYEINLNEGGALSVSIERNEYGSITLLAFITTTTTITLTNPRLILSKTENNVLTLIMKCETEDDLKTVDVILNIVGENNQLMKVTSYMLDNMKEVVGPFQVKRKSVQKGKTFHFDDIPSILSFRDPSLSSMFRL